MRPQFHFTPQSGWINDPHGISFHGGRYHVFYQYVPGRTTWAADCHWGHAEGVDLLSLVERPVALAPGDGDDGIWTGCLAHEDDGTTVAFYTSTTAPDVGIGRIRRATPDDVEWVSWSKGRVVAEAPQSLDVVAYRDPFVRREGDRWRMFVGAGLRDRTAMALTYVSDNLDVWCYDGVALRRSADVGDEVWMGSLWECPQIFELAGHGVMVSSVWDDDVLHYAGYAIGDYSQGRFAAKSWGRLTYGDSYYAPSLFTDEEGRSCVLLWLRGISDGEWVGAHSFPHRLSVHDGRLAATPHPDVSSHRGPRSEDGRIEGTAADIVWTTDKGELVVMNGEHEIVRMRRRGGTVLVSTIGAEEEVPVFGPVRLLIDGPVLEISSAGAIYAARLEQIGRDLRVRASEGELYVHPLI